MVRFPEAVAVAISHTTAIRFNNNTHEGRNNKRQFAAYLCHRKSALRIKTSLSLPYKQWINTVDETTTRRKLKFCSQEQDTVIEKEILGNDSIENVIIEHTSIPIGKTPELGMEFDSEEAAYKFYNEYAKLARFSVRRHTVHVDISGRILDRTFVCWRQGHRKKDKRDFATKSHRPETRNSCGAKMKIDARYTGKYMVIDFVVDHNSHELVSPSKTHFLRSHRTITAAQALQADDLDSSGIAPKAGFTLMARQMGGR